MKCYKCRKNPVDKLSMCSKCKQDLSWIFNRKRVKDEPSKTCKSSKGRRVIRKPILEDKYVRT